MSFSEMGSSLHRLDADVLTTAVNTEQTRRLSQRVAWLLDSLLGRYGPDLPQRPFLLGSWLCRLFGSFGDWSKEKDPTPVHWKVPFVWIWPGLGRWWCLRCLCWYKFVCHQIKFRSGQWGHLCLKGLFSRTTNGTLDANFKSEDHFIVILVAIVCKKIRLFNNTRWLGQHQRELRHIF